MEALVRHEKRTALLAYLAAALPRGPHRRDTLLALFWPDSDAPHARAALNQALYVLRTSLGDQAILTLGDGAVGLNSAVVWCDAAAFEAALDAGRPGDALALYRGDLLEGFFVTGAPEFERWLERERARLRERASEGVWAVAEERATARDTLEAKRWAHRAAELVPADEAGARRLMTFLHRLGDRAAAIRAYQEFTSRLAREYELEPSAETQALAAALREEEADFPVRLPGKGVAAPSRAQRKRVALVLTLIVGSLLTGGWLVFRALDAGSAEAARSSKRLVVLPFTNLGPADDEYFADGITEEIATRLAAVDRFRVIGSTTASVYKGTRKTLHEIGTELGVDYVVQGAIRWQKSTRGPARVRVTPQLVSTADGTHLWGEVYDEPLDEIFRVQSDIAQKVVQALDITLPESQRRAMAAAPTANVEAYDYYLRGNDYTSRGLDERYTRAAVRMYERAVELDPQFALAYAMLARVHSRMYWLYYDRSPGRLAQAKQAVDTAFVLQPDLPEAHHSLGTYYWLGHLDYDRALPEFAIAAAGRPADSRVFTARAVLRTRQGNFREALADFERAWQLDPGSAWIANYAEGCELARTFARAEALYDRAIALSPDRPGTYARKAELYLRWEGNTQQARTVLDEARTVGVADAPFVLFARVSLEIFDRRYDEAIALLTSGAPEVFQDQFRFVPRALLYAQVYGLMQRHGLERAYYDSARIIVSRKLHEQPDDPRLRSALGIAYAGLGRNSEAIQEGERAVELLPVNKEAWRGYYHEWDLARVYAMVGQSDAALDRLEHLLSIPGHVTAGWLRIDPTWDPLRGHPRFQRLVDRGKWGIRGPPRVRILVTVP